MALAMLKVVTLATESLRTTQIRTLILLARLMEVLFMFLPVGFRSKEFRLSIFSCISAEIQLSRGIRNKKCLDRWEVKLHLVWKSIAI